jgi:hypothetical protein
MRWRIVEISDLNSKAPWGFASTPQLLISTEVTSRALPPCETAAGEWHAAWKIIRRRNMVSRTPL